MLLFIIVALFGSLSAIDQAPQVLQSALSNPEAFRSLFIAFESQEGRHYVGAEKNMRARLFRNNLREVVEHNAKDGDDWQMELNFFSDMTDEERRAYTGANLTEIANEAEEVEPMPSAWGNPDSKDWRGVAVTKVKDQKSCGSCWIFSGVGALEGRYKTQGSILKSFSEQEGLDCIQSNGCGGGFMAKVYTWLKGSNRLSSMKSNPYRGKQGSCRYSGKPNALIAFRVTGYTNTKGDSNHVTALANSGPLSVGYSVASDFFKYRGGIYRNSRCSGGGHAVTSVGYTSSYFLMKNSWGASWGEKGYFRIGRGNVCGITNMGFAPTLQSTGKTDNGKDEEGDDDNDNDDDKTCEDKHSRCAEWANRSPSECAENWTYMRNNCQKSCQQCGCKDMSPKCTRWKGEGYCSSSSKYHDYMNFVCRKTCDSCGKDDDNDGGCPDGFKKCPDGSCVHQHWHC